MPWFLYKAIDKNGQNVSQEIETGSEAAVLQHLSTQNLVPISIVSVTPKGLVKPWYAIGSFGDQRLSLKVQYEFLSGFARLLKANIPILEALSFASENSASKKLLTAVSQIRGSIEDGNDLSGAISRQVGVFEPIVYALIKVGERTNNLASTTENCAKRIQTTIKTRAQFLSAILYPSFLVLMSFAVLGLIIFHLVPTLEPFFNQQGKDAPLGISVMIRIRQFLVSSGPEVLGLGALLTFFVSMLLGRYPSLTEALLLRLPIISSLRLNSENAQIATTLFLALTSGASLPVALTIAKETTGMKTLGRDLDSALSTLEDGTLLSTAFEASKLVSPILISFIRIGEKSGQLAELCGNAAEVLGENQTKYLDKLLQLMTPILTLFIGAIIGTVVFTAITAISEVNSVVF